MLKTMLFAAVIALSTFTSCKKETIDNATLLSSGKWIVTAATVNGRDNFSSNPICEKDDTWEFAASGDVNIGAGAIKCRSSDPQTEKIGVWSLSGTEQKKLVIIETSSSAVTLDIIELTGSTLKFSYLDSGDFSVFTFTKM